MDSLPKVISLLAACAIAVAEVTHFESDVLPIFKSNCLECHGDKVRMTPVQVGEAFGTGFVLKQGPGAGTKVVKDPPADLSDGQRIKERKG